MTATPFSYINDASVDLNEVCLHITYLFLKELVFVSDVFLLALLSHENLHSLPEVVSRDFSPTASGNVASMLEPLDGSLWWYWRKATGYDMLPPRVLKMTAEPLATPLTTIFNQAIEENRWPSAWKRGEWIPIYKKEDPLDKVNYRPVTVLTAVDKIFEQLICKQPSEMFEPIFDTFLSAYRKHFSCETTLIRHTVAEFF